MKASIDIESGIALAGLLLGLLATTPTRAAVIHVPVDYPAIQAAVNAAIANDTIQIASGVYVEQVVITNKPLTLIGSPGAVLRAKPGMAQSLAQPLAAYGGGPVPLLGIFGADVMVSGLTLEGERLADDQAAEFHGIYYLGSGGRVEGCRITGFRGRTLGSGAYASGIRVVHFGNNVVNIKVLNSTFADNLSSVELRGDFGFPTLLGTAFAVNDNVITGNGPDATGVQRGIVIDAGAGGEVVRNTITDHDYIGGPNPEYYAQGVLAGDLFHFDGSTPLAAVPPVRYEANVFRNNQQHMLVLRGDGSAILNNSFEGTGQGVRPWGVGISGLNPLIGTNRFSNLKTGILLFGNDPEFGTYLGLTTHAQVTANHFCDVSTHVMVEPLATDTEQGTLTCPFPPPALSIDPAVLLSWPDDGETHALESAPDPQGPWSPLDATPTVQDGQVTFAVKSEQNRQFFRLH